MRDISVAWVQANAEHRLVWPWSEIGVAVLAKIDSGLFGDVGESWRERLRRDGLAHGLNRDIHVAPVNPGVAGHQHFEHGLSDETEGDEPTVALE